MILTAAVAVAYVATDGFGRNSEPTVAPVPDGSSSTSTQPEGESDSVASPMQAAFAEGKSVVCVYAHESYDSTATLRSMDVFRIDQQTQGGLAHVIREPDNSLVWIDGMTEAMRFKTAIYEQDASGQYPTFNPVEFDTEALFADGTCQVEAASEDQIFELPTDVESVPAQP